MPTLITLKKNGKSFRVSNNRVISDEGVECPFCKAKLKEDDIFNMSGCIVQTEKPEDLLPKSLKQSMSLEEGLSIFLCKKCGSMFLEWEIGDYDSHEFYEMLDAEQKVTYEPRKGERVFKSE